MNNGGIAERLVNVAKAIAGRMPGALAQTNVIANMLFGAISGSGAAAAAAMGGTIGPLEEKEGYDPVYSAAVNIASAPTGMLIPPSNLMIVYSTIAGSVSVAALFTVPGCQQKAASSPLNTPARAMKPLPEPPSSAGQAKNFTVPGRWFASR